MFYRRFKKREYECNVLCGVWLQLYRWWQNFFARSPSPTIFYEPANWDAPNWTKLVTSGSVAVCRHFSNCKANSFQSSYSLTANWYFYCLSVGTVLCEAFRTQLSAFSAALCLSASSWEPSLCLFTCHYGDMEQILTLSVCVWPDMRQ